MLIESYRARRVKIQHIHAIGRLALMPIAQNVHARVGLKLVAGLLISSLLCACATYQTPGAGVNVGELSKSDQDIAEAMERKPMAHFPARIAVVRLESPNYNSYSNNHQCWGKGSYCVVTTRDIEKEEDYLSLAQLPMVAGVAPVGRLLLPQEMNSLKDLRMVAANLQTDMLLVYSLDTRFSIDSTDVGPLQLISLGFLPTKKARITTTASAVILDVRSGFVYGTAEASASDQQRATSWSTENAIESSRLKTESGAFVALMAEIEKLWKGIAQQYTGAK
jgi:hypothetical protein